MRLLVGLLCGAALALSVMSAAPIAPMTVTSPAFSSGSSIPDEFTCKGANNSPSLGFSGVPPGAKSLVVIVEDPDAPSGLFTHWMVWNISPSITSIQKSSVPSGASEGTNDFGRRGYGGPCPPSGTHRYFFRVLALDQTLSLKPGAPRKELDAATAGHVIARGDLMARCSH